MKKYIILTCLLFVVQLFAANNQEFRAVWVITWHHSSSSDDVEASKARIRTILDNVKAANMNAVLWQVRQGGTAYYNSSFEPWGPYSNGPYAGGYDVLEYAIEEAHKRGLELHAWFNVFAASSTLPGTPAQEHPDWICRDQANNPMTSSIALSPGLKEVRDYTLKVAMEVVNKYDIDGLHLDYIRWNEYYSSKQGKLDDGRTQKQRLLDQEPTPAEVEKILGNQGTRYLYDVAHPYSGGVPSGYASWEDWWRDSVTEFVKSLHDSVQAVKPWVRLTPAALGRYRWGSWQGYGSVYQDAALWFNKGYIEQLTPMHYHWTTADGFYDMLTGAGTDNWEAWIQEGIDAQRLFSIGPGSYILADNNLWYNHESIINKTRTVPWTDGYQFFSYGDWQEYRYWPTAAETFFKNKTKIRPVGGPAVEVPDAPQLSLQKQDSLHYMITVTPPVSIAENQWFAVYRSADTTPEPNSDELIDVHFGLDAYTLDDIFDGTQDFNGAYTYFATMLDRFWQESNPSNTTLSDSIPSFAPTVIQTYPFAGDSVEIGEKLKIYFSKNMEPSSFTNHVHLDNGAIIESQIWSDKDKSLTISIEGSLLYHTSYTLTLDKEITDVNGKQLDGLGDGGNSEPFVLTFHTISQDVSGPFIAFSNLSTQDSTVNVDVQSVFTLAFNELIDENTINPDNLKLVRGSNTVESRTKIFTADNRSIVSLQSTEDLGSYVGYRLELSDAITDTAGNPINAAQQMEFRTEPYAYATTTFIDELYPGSGNWWDPEGSGSTTGTIGSTTTFAYVNSNYLPANPTPFKRYSARIKYEWDPSAGEYLLREYCSGGDPRLVKFDTTYTVQCYVYGDGSNNQFRFALDEGTGSSWPDHEVSLWHTIDWVGWKLVEWDLGDPQSVGNWLGNGVLNGKEYRIDSFQLTHQVGASIKGTVYITDLRVVKKTPHITALTPQAGVVRKFSLNQNYPNPFNPSTAIRFNLDKAGVTKLVIYNMLGQQVAVPVNEHLMPGTYEVHFDGSNLASGTYIYELSSNHRVTRKKMILIK